MNPALVRRAASDVVAGEAATGNWFLGDVTEVVVERIVPRALEPESMGSVLAVTRTATGDLGEVSIIGNSAGWRGLIDGAKSQVAVTADGGRTIVRVQVALSDVALGEFMTFGTGIGLGGSFVVTALIASTLGSMTILAATPVALGGYLFARRRYQGVAARLRARAAEVADRVAAHVEGAGNG